MTDHLKQLKHELRAAGASASEVAALTPIAANLGRLRPTKAKSERRSFSWIGILKPASLALSGIAVGMALVIASQSVLPSSWLYPVQKLSDHVAVSVHPEYRETVMMRRAQQVNQLVADHAGSKVVLATLADYSQEAATYKSTAHADYAAFEYCKTNLRHAASSAQPQVSQAITASLDNLQTS